MIHTPKNLKLSKKALQVSSNSTSHTAGNIIFGPVLSRRFGYSLGVDLSPMRKQCNFDCVYCELHKAKPIESMEEILPPEQILLAITNAIKQHNRIDVLTFTATGEPTLYPYLYELISQTKSILPRHIKTLILSNGSNFRAKQAALKLFDIVKFSLDSVLVQEFKKIDRPSKTLNLAQILESIQEFARIYQGELVAEVLLVEGHNDTKENLIAIAQFLRNIRISRVDLGTIDRPSAYQVRPLTQEKLQWASQFFAGLPVTLPTRKMSAIQKSVNTKDSICSTTHNTSQSTTTSQTITSQPNDYDQETLLKLIATRPIEREEAPILFSTTTLKTLEYLLKNGAISIKTQGNNVFYTSAVCISGKYQ